MGIPKKHTANGFTIVELLIVIVIIAILAAITIVAYNGITQRAKNSAKLSTVTSITKLIRLYHAENGQYPIESDGGWCLTLDSQCTSYNGNPITNSNATLLTQLKKYGMPPNESGDNTGGTYYGIQYLYSTTRTLNSVANPLIIIFWLDGTNQKCAGAVAGMESVADGSGTMVLANQSKANTGTNQTRCYLMFPN